MGRRKLMMHGKTALICTTYNCKDELNAALETFTSPKNLALVSEIVIVDGGSRDGTWELLQQWAQRVEKLKVHQAPGANISRGRNEAIKRTDAEIIVTFDSGTTYSDDWLELMLKPFKNEQVSVVGGLTVCCGETLFEKCFAAFDERKRTDPLLGSSHRGIAYRREVWEHIGGYPEHVQAGEDTWFNTRWRKLGCNYVHVPDAKTYWRVRKSWKAVFRMARRNIKGHIAVGESSGTLTIVLITIVNIMVAVLLVLGFYDYRMWYLGAGLYAVYAAKRMIGKGRWRSFTSPAKALTGLYILTAFDVGASVGTIGGLILLLRRIIAYRKGLNYE